jgi:hypothetical protein
MKILTLVLAIPFLVLYKPAYCQVVYKCVDESGTVIYSQSSCATDAEQLYVEDSSSGMAPNRNGQIYEGAERAFEESHRASKTQNRKKSVVMKGRGLGSDRTLDGRDKAQVKAQREIERDFDKAIRNVRGTGANAARIRADLMAAKYKATSSGDRNRDRDFDRAIRNVRGTGADAERNRANLMAAKYGVEYKDFSYNKNKPNYTTPRPRTPAFPIPSNKGGMYIPTGPDGSQYISPGGGICNKEGPNLNCGGTVKPASGVVVEQDW